MARRKEQRDAKGSAKGRAAPKAARTQSRRGEGREARGGGWDSHLAGVGELFGEFSFVLDTERTMLVSRCRP